MSGVNTIDKFGRKRKFASLQSPFTSNEDGMFSRRSEMKQLLESEITNRRLRAAYIEHFDGVKVPPRQWYQTSNNLSYLPILIDISVKFILMNPPNIKIFLNAQEVEKKSLQLLRKGDVLQFKVNPQINKISCTLIGDYSIWLDKAEDTPFVSEEYTFKPAP